METRRSRRNFLSWILARLGIFLAPLPRQASAERGAGSDAVNPGGLNGGYGSLCHCVSSYGETTVSRMSGAE